MRPLSILLLTLALPACSGAPTEEPAPQPVAEPPPELPTPLLPAPSSAPAAVRLHTPGPQALRLLDTLGPHTRVSLPERVGPSGDTLALDTWSKDAETGLWTHPSPTRFDHQQYRATPPGSALVSADGTPVPYFHSLVDKQACRNTDTCWEVRKGTLYYTGPDAPSVQLQHSPTKADDLRRSPARSGLSPHAFVDWTATIAGLTREALLVPAGGSVQLTVDIPANTTLRFGLGAPAPRRAVGEDTPTARILVDGTQVWAGSTTTDAPWSEHTVDLSAYSSSTVTLSFETTPGTDSALGRAVAFAEPSIVPTVDPTAPVRRVVVIGIDTLRLDHLGLHGGPADLTPGLDAWGKGAILFDNARAPAPRTRPSFRSALTGRWPLEAIQASPLTRHFADAGFSTAGIVANVHLQPHLGFADGAGWWDYHDSDDAEPQVDRAIAWLDAHAGEDSFLFLHLMDPHIFYLAPEPFQDAFTAGMKQAGLPDRYNRWTLGEAEQKGRLKPVHKRFIQARYKGEVRYLDQHLARLLHHIDQLPGDTVVVLHSDHGEEFWDHGDFEHNHSLYDELMRTMLWIRPPGGWSGGPTRVDVPVSLVDIVPTLHSLFGLSHTEALDGTSLAPWLDPHDSDGQATLHTQLTDRPLQMGHMMFAREQWGVLHKGWTYTLETMTGAESAHHLPTDPTQQNNRTADAPLDDLRAALSASTGWPVGPGWRIKVEGLKVPFSLHFDTPVQAAGVIDPEAGRTRRANLEWGEVPPVLPTDVAAVELSDDGHTLSVVPGPKAEGTLYVLGPDAQTTATVRTDGMPDYTVTPGSRMLGKGTARIAAGPLLVPTQTEASMLAEQGDPRLYEALREMGYIE